MKKLFEGDNLDKQLLDNLYLDPETYTLFMKVGTEEYLVRDHGISFNKILASAGDLDCMDHTIRSSLVKFVRGRMRKFFP